MNANKESETIGEDIMNETLEDGSCLSVLDLFSGIGGFSLGLERTGGFKTVAFCEIEEYPRKVLAKHWPGVPIYEDVRELTADRLRADGITPDVITGGFPCQDISVAGKQKGIEAERSGLWSECARLLGELRPDYAIFENVTALLSGDSGRWFQRVLWDISQVGYDAEWHCIPASELGAHHHRDRVWILAYPRCVTGRLFVREDIQDRQTTIGTQSSCQVAGSSNVANPEELISGAGLRCDQAGEVVEPTNGGDVSKVRGSEKKNREREANIIKSINAGISWSTEPNVGRVANGIPKRVDRLKGLGNAVVPQIPELIGRAIIEEINSQS
jgi:DNA (cytosine-5)-methyltransferase 1